MDNLSNWWTEADLKNFKERAQCVVDQFNSFEVEKGLNMNGRLVLGESIADLGGVVVNGLPTTAGDLGLHGDVPVPA